MVWLNALRMKREVERQRSSAYTFSWRQSGDGCPRKGECRRRFSWSRFLASSTSMPSIALLHEGEPIGEVDGFTRARTVLRQFNSKAHI